MRQALFSNALRLSMLMGSSVVVAIATTPFDARPAAAAVLDAWSFDVEAQHLSVTLPQGITPRYLVLAEPARIILEIPNTQLGPTPTRRDYDGQVSSIRVAQYSANKVRIVMELAPGTRLDPRHAQLSSAPINGQVRWTLMPLLVDSTAIAQSSLPSEPPDRPSQPSADNALTNAVPSPPPSVPAQPVSPSDSVTRTADGTVADTEHQPRLSTSASNLMLPSIGDDLTDLPEVLPLDPFSTPADSTTQVRVPDLDETVAISPTPPPAASSSPAPSEATPTPPPPAVKPSAPGLSPEASEATAPSAETSIPAATPPNAGASEPTSPSVAVGQSVLSTPPPTEPIREPSRPNPTPPVSPPTSIAMDSPPTPPPATAEPITITPPSAASSPQPGQSPPANTTASAPPRSEQPLRTPPPAPPSQTDATPPPAQGTTTIAPPPIATENASAVPAAANSVVFGSPASLPTSNTTNPADSTAPPGESITFGQPLPEASGKALGTSPGDPDNPIPRLTDVLLPAGSLLTLRYPGSQPITIDPNATAPATLVLEADLRDSANRLVAPAGSEMIGHFEPTPTGQRWVSDTLVLPQGRVTLNTTSDYLAAAPEISGGNVALNSGIGALAVAVLTGFSGFGLLGGAVVGATTAVGTSPQTIMIHPDEVIEVRVLEDITYAALDWSNPQPVSNNVPND